MDQKQLVKLEKPQVPMIKLTAAALRELRLLYQSGAIGRLQLNRLLGFSAVQALAVEKPMPKEEAQEFLFELKKKMEGKLEHRT